MGETRRRNEQESDWQSCSPRGTPSLVCERQSVPAHRNPQYQLFKISHSVTSEDVEIGHNGNAYTVKTGGCHKSGLSFFSVFSLFSLPLGSILLNIYQYSLGIQSKDNLSSKAVTVPEDPTNGSVRTGISPVSGYVELGRIWKKEKKFLDNPLV